MIIRLESPMLSSNSSQQNVDHPLADPTGQFSEAIDFKFSSNRNRRRSCSEPPLARSTAATTASSIVKHKPSRKLHILKPGDTLEGICVLYGISMAELKKTNKIWNVGEVFLRKHLEIPSHIDGRQPERTNITEKTMPVTNSDDTLHQQGEERPSTLDGLFSRIDEDIKQILDTLPNSSPTSPVAGKRRLYPPPALPGAKLSLKNSPANSPKSSPRARRVKVRPNPIPTGERNYKAVTEQPVPSNTNVKPRDPAVRDTSSNSQELSTMHSLVEMTALTSDNFQ
ncbi:hypothetical protein DFS34DRAFT_622249 [Phlyctochytrium arcticum]|nr:hypothetical protein DFS34DRAFT_622249 [Phlyctochytrium arcticum]